METDSEDPSRLASFLRLVAQSRVNKSRQAADPTLLPLMDYPCPCSGAPSLPLTSPPPCSWLPLLQSPCCVLLSPIHSLHQLPNGWSKGVLLGLAFEALHSARPSLHVSHQPDWATQCHCPKIPAQPSLGRPGNVHGQILCARGVSLAQGETLGLLLVPSLSPELFLYHSYLLASAHALSASRLRIYQTGDRDRVLASAAPDR